MNRAREFELPAIPFDATVSPPGDKSLGHRALILAAMAEGQSVVTNAPQAGDMDSTRSVLSSLGVENTADHIRSPGIANWASPGSSLDCGNSGTTMRLLAGAIAGSRVSATLVGDESLMRRPMARLVDPLGTLGAKISVPASGTAPIEISGTSLVGANVNLPMASAQVRTAVAFAALSAAGETEIDSPPGFRDHTERWLAYLGLGEALSPTRFRVTPRDVAPFNITVPGDTSSAAFVWAAAAVVAGSRIVTPNVSLNSGRTGFLEILKQMGCLVAVELGDPIMGDPVGTVTVEAASLDGIEVGGDLAVRALDELPLLAVVAAAATGSTVVSGAAELRVKESDRIASSVALADLAGARGQATADGFIVEPAAGAANGGATLDARGDHRVAMAAAIASLVRRSRVSVSGFASADVSWPGFGKVMEGLWS
jgi:3-phosphoshikimate 1-carboxyvinyltransferase